ncbi:MAG: glutaredoxin family protein [Candidatus Undinarchaeales archaeon]|jgi:glutaredoxin-like YruB-family protein|nr:glutaredoxin family protein [Candidatus Undinarchaeales archaeon]MDP7492766.1 glutaredoxin family protein [Candidatus Undinarchaeales archaeon]
MADITVYSTPTCPYCKMVKAFLNEKGVEFKDIDVSTDRDAGKTMIEKSGQMGVPQIEINDKIIVGFNKEALERELESV